MKIIRFSQKGLVGYWRFDEETGSTAKDSSPYGNDGTIYGATRVRGIIGKALSFDGVDDYVEVPDSASLDIADEITVMAWVKLAEKMDGKIVSKGRDWNAAEAGFIMDYQTNGFRGGVVDEDRNVIIAKKIGYDVGVWYHVVMTYEGDTRLWVNGENVATQPGYGKKIHTNNYNLTIGRASWKLGCFFNGLIGEVRIYNKALSPGEIKIIYAFTKYIKPHPIIMRRKL